MTTSDENATVSVTDAYDVDRRGQLLARIQWAALLALGPIALAVPFNVWAFAQTAAMRLILLSVVALVCLAGLLLTRNRAAAAHPDALATLFVLAIAACTGRLILESPEDLVQYYDPTDLFGNLAETLAEQFPSVDPDIEGDGEEGA